MTVFLICKLLSRFMFIDTEHGCLLFYFFLTSFTFLFILNNSWNHLYFHINSYIIPIDFIFQGAVLNIFQSSSNVFILVHCTLLIGFLNSLKDNFLKLNMLIFLYYIVLLIIMMYGSNWWQMFPSFFLNFSPFFCYKEMVFYVLLGIFFICCHSVISKTTTVSSFK